MESSNNFLMDPDQEIEDPTSEIHEINPEKEKMEKSSLNEYKIKMIQEILNGLTNMENIINKIGKIKK